MTQRLSVLSIWMILLGGCYATSPQSEEDEGVDGGQNDSEQQSETQKRNGEQEDSNGAKEPSTETDDALTDNAATDNGLFEIYLIKGDDEELQALVRGADKVSAAVDDVELEKNPIISSADIAAYIWDDHRFYLTTDGAERIIGAGLGSELATPVPVVVTANGVRIYIATFWPIVLSSLPECPTVTFVERDGERPPLISIVFFGDNWQSEAVNDPRIYDALESSGLLVPISF